MCWFRFVAFMLSLGYKEVLKTERKGRVLIFHPYDFAWRPLKLFEICFLLTHIQSACKKIIVIWLDKNFLIRKLSIYFCMKWKMWIARNPSLTIKTNLQLILMLGIFLVLISNFFIRIICPFFLRFWIKPFWFIYILYHCERRTFTKWFYSYTYNPRTFDKTQLLIPKIHCFERSSWHN